MGSIGWQDDALQELSQKFIHNLVKVEQKHPKFDPKIVKQPPPITPTNNINSMVALNGPWQQDALQELSQKFYHNLEKLKQKKPKLHPKVVQHQYPNYPTFKNIHNQVFPSSKLRLQLQEKIQMPKFLSKPKLKANENSPMMKAHTQVPQRNTSPQAFQNFTIPRRSKIFKSLAKEWAWLHNEIHKSQTNMHLFRGSRKGDLPTELIHSIWGKDNRRHDKINISTSPLDVELQAIEEESIASQVLIQTKLHC
jgi:hypothetical protein